MVGSTPIEIAFPVEDYLDELKHHARVLAEAARSVAMDTPVPTCPGWTVLDLLQHTESVYLHKSETIRGDYRTESAPRIHPPRDGDLASFEASLDELIDVFEAADLSVPSSTWCQHEQHRAGWWVRRMAQETLIHGADAVIAAAGIPDAEVWLALDGVDELLDEMMIGGPSWGVVTPGNGRIDISANDRTWPLRFGQFAGTSPSSGKMYEKETVIFDTEGTPDAVVTTDPVALNFWLWGRGILSDSAQQGDPVTVTRLRSVAAASTQ